MTHTDNHPASCGQRGGEHDQLVCGKPHGHVVAGDPWRDMVRAPEAPGAHDERREWWAVAIDQVFADWEQGMAARPQDALTDAAMAVADAEHEELMQRLARTTEMAAGLQAETARLRAERDRARRIAVALENQLAELTDRQPAHGKKPGLLTCLVPTCTQRPGRARKGWKSLRASSLLPEGGYVCPGHADLVATHLPQAVTQTEPAGVAAHCSCGTWTSPMLRWHGAARGLWEDHLLNVADTHTTPTGGQR
ncbi:hypothetical protein ACF1DY_26005 [Streptomyces albus]